MFELLDWKSWFTAVVIVVMIGALIRGVSRPHYIFLIALLSLLMTGILSPLEALSGFISNAVLTVGALFIVAAGVQQTMLFTWLEKYMLPGHGATGHALFRIMSSASVMSSFLNNTPIVAMLAPHMQHWAHKIGISPSKLLIPLSYAAIVGGTITLIGTSTNIVVSEMLHDRGYGAFHLFQLAWIGIPATILVITWFALIGHRFLPDRVALNSVEPLDIKSESNHRAANSLHQTTTDIEIENVWLQEHGNQYAFASTSAINTVPYSHNSQPSLISRIFRGDFANLFSSGSEHRKTPPAKKHSFPLLAILFLMIVFSATGVLPIHISVLLAALATILTGALPVRKIIKSINFSILTVIAAALGIGVALESTGLASFIAFSVIDTTTGLGVVVILTGLYVMTNLLTELITNNAAAVLMIPIALSSSLSMGIDPQAVGMTVAVAASASFLTPIGYQTNLMVMDVGGYRFADYFKAGLPVTLILMFVTITMVTWLWV